MDEKERSIHLGAEQRAIARRVKTLVSKPLVSEADIERTCTEFLAWDDWRALKTDPVSRREWGKGFGELGMADHLYIRYAGSNTTYTAANGLRSYAEVLWIEWKRKGGKAEAHQETWHTLERARGALTLIAGRDFAASIEGFRQWYEASGLRRRKPTA